MVSSKSINVCAEIFQKVSLPSLRSTRNNKACTKSEATRETESLAHLIENAGTSSSSAVFLKANRSFKGSYIYGYLNPYGNYFYISFILIF